MIESTEAERRITYLLTCDISQCHHAYRLIFSRPRPHIQVRQRAQEDGWRFVRDKDSGDTDDVCPSCVLQLIETRITNDQPVRFYDFGDLV